MDYKDIFIGLGIAFCMIGFFTGMHQFAILMEEKNIILPIIIGGFYLIFEAIYLTRKKLFFLDNKVGFKDFLINNLIILIFSTVFSIVLIGLIYLIFNLKRLFIRFIENSLSLFIKINESLYTLYHSKLFIFIVVILYIIAIKYILYKIFIVGKSGRNK